MDIRRSILPFFLGLGLGLFPAFFFAGFLLGSSSVRRPASPDPNEVKCTCVPCLPDHFCKKCGHKSRDCPKLYRFFHSSTNIQNDVLK